MGMRKELKETFYNYKVYELTMKIEQTDLVVLSVNLLTILSINIDISFTILVPHSFN